MWLEERDLNETGTPSTIQFNARISGGWLNTALTAADSQNDVAGAYLTIEFQDGSQGQPADGSPDIRAYNLVGYLPPFNNLPQVAADGSRFKVTDVRGVHAYVIDRAGNVSHAFDPDLSR
jgi:hypothetical protein